MKYTAILAIVAAFGIAGAAYAAEPAPAAAAKPAAASVGKSITADDLKKMCDFRFKDKAKRHARCIKNGQAAVGKPMNKKQANTINKVSQGIYYQPKTKKAAAPAKAK